MRPWIFASSACLLIAVVLGSFGCDSTPVVPPAQPTPVPTETVTASRAAVDQAATTAATSLARVADDAQQGVKAIDAAKLAEARQRLLAIHQAATGLSRSLATAFSGLKANLGGILTAVENVGHEREQWQKVAEQQQARAEKAEARADSAARKWFAAMAALGGAAIVAGFLLVWLLPGGTKLGLMIAGVAGAWTAVMLALIRWYEELAWAGLIGLIVLVVAVLAAVAFMVFKRIKQMQAAKKTDEIAVAELVELNEEQKKRLDRGDKEALFGKPGENPWLAPARQLMSEATIEMVDKVRTALGVKK